VKKKINLDTLRYRLWDTAAPLEALCGLWIEKDEDHIIGDVCCTKLARLFQNSATFFVMTILLSKNE